MEDNPSSNIPRVFWLFHLIMLRLGHLAIAGIVRLSLSEIELVSEQILRAKWQQSAVCHSSDGSLALLACKGPSVPSSF